MATSLKESKKDVRIEKIHAKIMKIGLVDPEIALLMLTSDEDGQTPHKSPRWARPDATDNSVTPRAPIFIPRRRGAARRRPAVVLNDVLVSRRRRHPVERRHGFKIRTTNQRAKQRAQRRGAISWSSRCHAKYVPVPNNSQYKICATIKANPNPTTNPNPKTLTLTT